MSQIGSTSLVVLMVLGIAILVAGTHSFRQLHDRMNVPQNSASGSSVLLSPEPASAQPQSSPNWTTHANRYFSVDYPLSWQVDTLSVLSRNEDLYEVNLNSRPHDGSYEYNEVYILVTRRRLEELAQTYIDELQSERQQEIIVDGINGRRLSGYGGVAGTVHKSVVYMERADVRYLLVANTYNNDFGLFNGMLASFQFVD